jgi:hypothetical protein
MLSRKPFGTMLPLAFVGLALVLLAGCNSGIDLGTVTGHITKDGKPQPKLIVNFSPGAGHRGSQGYTDADGRYELIYTLNKMGAVPGQHHVTITPEQKNNEILLSKDVDVTSGPNTFDFDLGDIGTQQKAK